MAINVVMKEMVESLMAHGEECIVKDVAKALPYSKGWSKDLPLQVEFDSSLTSSEVLEMILILHELFDYYSYSNNSRALTSQTYKGLFGLFWYVFLVV